jgi:transcription factor MYB, plant
VKPAKRRAVSEVELGVPDTFGTNGWSTAPPPGSASAITFNHEMQRFMSLLPLSLDEHNWNAQV